MSPTKNERLKWGLDNPDSVYSISRVDGNLEYELAGNKGFRASAKGGHADA